MKRMSKPVYLAAGAYTVSLGTGRPEFHPKKPRPGIEQHLQEAGRAALAQTAGAQLIDEGVVGNFMAARFVKQGHLGSLMVSVDPALALKPMIRVEGACASGGLALATGIKNVLSGLADTVLVAGVEVQNTVKAMYGADILAGAGWFSGERKDGPAYFFPGKFSERAGAYSAKVGAELARKAMAHWYAQAIEHARLSPLSQEYTNKTKDLIGAGLAAPDARNFTEHLNYFDCSKVSDGAAALVVCSEEGLARLGLTRADAVEVVGIGHATDDLTQAPRDLTEMTTSRRAVELAREMAGITVEDLGLFEVHDCFTISGLLSVEALGLAPAGGAPDLVMAGETKRTGKYPTNLSGGLIGYGHPTGATGVRMAVDLWKQLTGKGGEAQVNLAKDHGILVSMGGNDRTVVSLVVKR